MKFFALIALATLAIAAPLGNKATTTSAAPQPTGDCIGGGCNGSPGWKRDVEVIERAVVEERLGAKTSSSAASQPTGDCIGGGCNGSPGWKRAVVEERLGAKSSTASAKPTGDCIGGGCNGSPGW